MRINIDNENIFFISDLHLYHENVLKHDKRPFDNIQHMHDVLIENWNNTVNDKSLVIVAGDLSFRGPEPTIEILNKLKGNIIHVYGNHDKPFTCDKIIKQCDYLTFKFKGQLVVVSHFPILFWDGIYRGSIHVHGHMHGSLLMDENYSWYYKHKVVDVACNVIGYKPKSYTKILEETKNRFVPTKH